MVWTCHGLVPVSLEQYLQYSIGVLQLFLGRDAGRDFLIYKHVSDFVAVVAFVTNKNFGFWQGLAVTGATDAPFLWNVGLDLIDLFFG